jgi:hypothetical protein
MTVDDTLRTLDAVLDAYLNAVLDAYFAASWCHAERMLRDRGATRAELEAIGCWQEAQYAETRADILALIDTGHRVQ